MAAPTFVHMVQKHLFGSCLCISGAMPDTRLRDVFVKVTSKNSNPLVDLDLFGS